MDLHLSTLPESQQRLWIELDQVPRGFVLYGGTALALRLGHRISVDFDFFSSTSFDPERLKESIPFAREAEVLQIGANAVTMLVDRGGPVNVSFFGGLGFGRLEDPQTASGNGIAIASVIDVFASKLKTILQRSEAKDYIDIAAIVASGIPLEKGLGAAMTLYGGVMNPLLPLKALCYFEDGDLSTLRPEVRECLISAVAGVGEIPGMERRSATLIG
jgi:Nucleotidyl transferase AbiEii toxin, Type IV TA system